MADVAMEIQETAQEPKPEYVFPPIELLSAQSRESRAIPMTLCAERPRSFSRRSIISAWR